MINATKFFDAVRDSIFEGHLKQSQVDGLTLIYRYWEYQTTMTDVRHLAYILATAYHETAATMQPIEEFNKGKGRLYGVPYRGTGKTYYGRGYVQLTWVDNYRVMGKRIGVDLYNNPEMALIPDIAVKVIFIGMEEGRLTGKKLSDYFDNDTEDWVNARRIVNSTDRAQLIANIAKKFLSALS